MLATKRSLLRQQKLDDVLVGGKNSIAAIQGFGNVSQYAAVGFVEMLGGQVACVSCWDRHDKKSYTYSKKGGIDPRFLLTIVDEYGTIGCTL